MRITIPLVLFVAAVILFAIYGLDAYPDHTQAILGAGFACFAAGHWPWTR